MRWDSSSFDLRLRFSIRNVPQFKEVHIFITWVIWISRNVVMFENMKPNVYSEYYKEHKFKMSYIIFEPNNFKMFQIIPKPNLLGESLVGYFDGLPLRDVSHGGRCWGNAAKTQ